MIKFGAVPCPLSPSLPHLLSRLEHITCSVQVLNSRDKHMLVSFLLATGLDVHWYDKI